LCRDEVTIQEFFKVDEEEMNVSVFDYISIDCFDLNKNYCSALQQIHSVITFPQTHCIEEAVVFSYAYL